MRKNLTQAELKELLQAADKAYYENDSPIMTDREYDELVGRWASMAGDKWMTLGTPSLQLTRVPHVIPMLSLEKVNSVAELQAWVPVTDSSLVLAPKIDGCSCTLRYEHGKLVQALSRGDGYVGESVLQALRQIIGRLPGEGGIPSELRGATRSMEVRGEIVIFNEHFHLVGGANPRNSAAGLLRRQESSEKQSYLRFVAYRVVNGKEQVDYADSLLTLANWGFLTPPTVIINENVLKNWTSESLHPNSWCGRLPYEIDGVVLTLERTDKWVDLGETNKYPRWACAYKFATDEAETKLLAVEWHPARTGVITPVYVFEAVKLCGTVVTRATGHNLEQYLKLGAGVGDRVMVRKSNEIIPQVIRKLA